MAFVRKGKGGDDAERPEDADHDGRNPLSAQAERVFRSRRYPAVPMARNAATSVRKWVM